jgi:hypothetical protein
MLQTVSRLLPELPLILMTAVATDAAQTQANGTLRTGGPGRFPPFETDVGIEVSMTLHESNHGTQNGKNGPVQ